MKLEFSTKAFAVFVLVAMLAAGLIAAQGSAVAQTDDSSSLVDAVVAEAVSDTSREGVAAAPMELPLSESDLVGSVMYHRSGEFERFDTDHDIDPPQSARSAGGASGASGASGSSGDREIIGSHYILGNTFNVRVPSSFAGKPAGVFAFSFNHVVLQAGSGRFTADCDNQRVFAYKDSGAARWRCDLDFGNGASGWAESVASASQVSIGTAWSDEDCDGGGAFGISKEELLLIEDCKALLAVKHHWFDEHPQNRVLLSAKHVLRSWGSGDIKSWRGVSVGGFHMTESQFKDNCVKVRPTCPLRVLGVDLSGHGQGGIGGKIPEELGGVENSGGNCAKVKGSGFGSGFAGVGCGLGALQALDLSGNALGRGIPWQLGNVSGAPCSAYVAVNDLDLAAVASLGVALFAVLAVPFTAGLSLSAKLTLGALGVAVGVGGAVVDVDVELGRYFVGCQDVAPPSRDIGSGGDGGGVSFERDRFAHGFGGGERVGERYDELGKALFPSVLSSTEAAGDVLGGVADDELITVTAGRFSGRVSAGSIKAAGRFAGFLGALMDVRDIASGLYSIEEQEFLRLDRSQLQFLDLSGNQLRGEVPLEVGNLDSLEYLYLNDNRLWGSIPGDAGRGGRPVHDKLVHLNVSGNGFSGGVPSRLSTRLRAVDFSGNELSGSVPSSLVLSLGLEHLDLSGNKFSGELPASVANMDNLKFLYLGGNFLSGMLPSGIGKIHGGLCLFGVCLVPSSVSVGQLRHIDVSDNLFFGEIPGNLGNLSSLSRLDLRYNCFSGAVPKSLSEKSASVGFSFFYDYNLLDSSSKRTDGVCGPCFNGGYLPADADENLKRDCVVLLSLKNHWGSSFPHRWGEAEQESLSSWAGVDLRYPGDLSKEGNRVVGLRLPDSGLAGILPASLAGLGALEVLRLDGNRLDGEIPASFGNWRNFRILDLSGNMLSGEIPIELARISSPVSRLELDLSGNRLTGGFPKFHEAEGVQRVHFSSIDLSDNRLGIGLVEVGSTPTFSRNVYTRLERLDISGNYFTRLMPLGHGFDNNISGGIKTADYSGNLLTGSIPEELGYSTTLEELDFSGNFLTGRIPASLADIVNLKHLDLSSNCFSATVPRRLAGKQRLTIRLERYSGSSNPECEFYKCTDGTYVPNKNNRSLQTDCANLLRIREQWQRANGGVLPVKSFLREWGQGSYTRIQTWPGIAVSKGRVTQLVLEKQGLKSEIPEEIYGLTALTGLDLSGNELTGELSPQVSRLADLTRLDLSANKLAGRIPEDIARLTALQNLDLSANKLTGGIPQSLRHLEDLQVLNLSANALTGLIPTILDELASLRTLNLAQNKLTGTIPTELGSLSRLRSLKLQNNKLTGAIPEELASIPGLSSIGAVNLNANCLLGPVPARLTRVTVARSNLFGTANDNADCGHPCLDGTFVPPAPRVSRGVSASPLAEDCRVLWTVRKHFNTASPTAITRPQNWGTSAYQDITTWPGITVRQNRVTAVNLSAKASAPRNQRLRGTVPAALGDLTALEILNLSRNRLYGTIPSEISDLRSLKTLNLSRNLLSGPAPASLGRLASLLTLNLSYNRLTGQPPSATTRAISSRGSVLARPQNLERLYLNDNEFEGIIPSQIGSHANLKALRLSNNNLHGPIPASVISLRLLSDLRLDGNNLTGTAPQGMGTKVTLRYLYLQNNCLTGQDPRPALITAYWRTAYSRGLGSLRRILNSLPVIRTQNNLFDNAASENKACRQICRNSVANPDRNTELVEDCETLLEIRDNWAAQTTLPEGSAMATWGSHANAGKQHSINRWQGITVTNNRITGLDLSGHAFTSSVPAGLENLTALTSLSLSDNQLSSFPEQIFELDKLEQLNLNDNRITALPANIDNLEELATLNLGYNDIAVLPESVSELELLTDLNLASNNLNNSTTRNLNAIAALKSLKRLNLSNNWFTGSVPNSFRNLTSLTHLDMSNNRFSGRIPAFISTLTQLQYLNLESNNLLGAIPPEIGKLRNLVYLNFSLNSLSGAIPREIGNLQNLERFFVFSSRLSGNIPSEIGNLLKLQSVSLANNRLSGPIPSEIGNLRNLKSLYLLFNQLSGRIPSEIGSLRNLEELVLYNNNLLGPIPSQIGNLRNLERLDLGRNNLYGRIPREIGNLRDLKYFYLQQNRLSGFIPREIGNLRNLEYFELFENLFYGYIPTEIGNLRNLKRLKLGYNGFYGSIPTEIGNLHNLEELDLGPNYLSGSIPSEIGSLRNLETLTLGSNDLSGSIPTEIGNLRNLRYLNLFRNYLSGTIPSEIGNLRNLETLSLGSNLLSGSIPTEIGNLRNLRFLYLADNRLTGTIPPEIGNLRNLRDIYLHDNRLSGPIPPAVGNLPQLTRLHLYNNDLCGPIPDLPSRIQRIYIYFGNPRIRLACP